MLVSSATKNRPNDGVSPPSNSAGIGKGRNGGLLSKEGLLFREKLSNPCGSAALPPNVVAGNRVAHGKKKGSEQKLMFSGRSMVSWIGPKLTGATLEKFRRRRS